MIEVRRAWLAGVLLVVSGAATSAQTQPPGFPAGRPTPADAEQPKVPPIAAEYARCMESGIALVNAQQYKKARRNSSPPSRSRRSTARSTCSSPNRSPGWPAP